MKRNERQDQRNSVVGERKGLAGGRDDSAGILKQGINLLPDVFVRNLLELVSVVQEGVGRAPLTRGP